MAEATVLYDEGCAFCARLTARLARLDGVEVAIGSAAGVRAALRDLSPAQRYAALHIVDAEGRRRSGVNTASYFGTRSLS